MGGKFNSAACSWFDPVGWDIPPNISALGQTVFVWRVGIWQHLVMWVFLHSIIGCLKNLGFGGLSLSARGGFDPKIYCWLIVLICRAK